MTRGRGVARWAARAAAALAGLGVAAAVGAWAFLAIEDARLGRAFERALAEAAPPTAPAGGAGGEGSGGGSVGGGSGGDGGGDGSVDGGTTLALSLVSFNVWALPVRLPGLERVRRLPRIPAALAGFGADLILLQEAFDVRMKAFLGESFRDYHARSDVRCREPMFPVGHKDCTGGLLTFSRWPLREERFFVHPVGEGAKFDEAKGRKGFLLTTVETPLGPLDVVNIHLYAGRTAVDEAQRLVQLGQLRDVLGREGGSARPVLLVGDLNVVHPSLSSGGGAEGASAAYRFVVDSLGFVDTRPVVGEGDLTYDVATNRYADLWYNRFEGRQVFDYVMARLPEGMSLEVVERRRVLDGADPLSDHYGVYAVLAITSAGVPR